MRRAREALGLYPLRDLRRSDDAGTWITTGPDPVLALGPAAAVAALSGARVRIRCRAEGAVLLLAVEAGGAAEPRRYRLTPAPAGTDDLIRLPPDTRALHLLPGDAPARFRLDAVALEPVGRVAALPLLARKVLERLPPQERRPLRLLRRAVGLARTVPPGEIWRRLTRAAATARPPATYAAWIAAVEAPALPAAPALHARAAAMPAQAPLSLLMDARGADPGHLAEALASLRGQVYPHWELCLAGSPPGAAPSDDPRIRRLPAGADLGAALAAARGDHVGAMEPDAVLPPHALLAFARRLAAEPGLDLVYADEDRIGPDGARTAPRFKPDWSPETLEAGFYIGRLALLRTALARAVGGLADGSEAGLYDLALRATERTDRVGHIAQVLYHRRSAGEVEAEPACAALAGRARRSGGLESVRALAPGAFSLRRSLGARPPVSIVIPTAGRDSTVRGETVDLLAACLASLRGTSTYEPIEIVAVDNGDLRPATQAALARHGARSVTWEGPSSTSPPR